MRESADGRGPASPSPVRTTGNPTGPGLPELPTEGRRGTSEILLTELSADRQPVAPQSPGGETVPAAVGDDPFGFVDPYRLPVTTAEMNYRGFDRAERALIYTEIVRVATLLTNAVNNMNRAQMNHLGPGLLLAIETLKTEARNVRGVNPRRHTNNTGPRL